MSKEPNPYSRLVELCDRLTTATMLKQLEWTAEHETAFFCARKSGSIAIRSRDRDGEPPYELAIYNPNGNQVESLLSEWLPDDEPAFWNKALTDLYRAARRQALGVDLILDDLFAELPSAPAADETAGPVEQPARR
jgi:hypothetical protein